MRRMRQTGFTLIELLIVVAIIAILAAIAVVNFLEAQTRAKISRATADMRTLVVGLSSYYGDTNHILPAEPLSPLFGQKSLDRLTTPVSYLTSLPNDPFWLKSPGDPNDPEGGTFGYVNMEVVHELGFTELSDLFEHTYFFASRSPDGDFDANNTTAGGMIDDFQSDTSNSVYNPTNGTVSSGDLFRSQLGVIGAGAQSSAGEH